MHRKLQVAAHTALASHSSSKAADHTEAANHIEAAGHIGAVDRTVAAGQVDHKLLAAVRNGAIGRGRQVADKHQATARTD